MPKFRVNKICFIFFVFFLISFNFSTLVSANRPFNPFLAGNSIGEPMMDLGSVVVEKETLTIDLRELANFKRSQLIEFTSEYSSRLALIETIYKIRNDKETQNISLNLFGDINSFNPNAQTGFWLDGQPINMEPFDDTLKELPINWGIPNYTISINGNWRIPYRPLLKSPIIRFKLDIPSGSHTIKIRYLAQPSTYLQGEDTLPWQFVYVLTPARDWVGFTGIDATIYIPKEWRFSSNVKLNPQGEKITGNWLSIPGNSLSLTVQIPTPSFFKFGMFAWLFGPLLCLFLGSLIGKFLKSTQKGLVLAVPISALSAIIWVLLIYFLMSYDQNHLKLLVGEGQLARPNNSFVKIASLPFAFMLGFVLTQIAAFFSHRNVVEKQS